MPPVSRRTWTSEEDDTIHSLVNQLGEKQWARITRLFNERFHANKPRLSKQCRERWLNQLRPSVNKLPWSEQQIRVLFDSHQEYGNRWSKVTKRLPGRTDNSIKNQFYSCLRKILRRIYRRLATKSSTVKIKGIKPAILSSVLAELHSSGEIIDQSTGSPINFYQLLFKYANDEFYQSSKNRRLDPQEKQQLEYLLHKLLDGNQGFNVSREFRTLREAQKPTRHKQSIGSNPSSGSSQQDKQSEQEMQMEADNDDLPSLSSEIMPHHLREAEEISLNQSLEGQDAVKHELDEHSGQEIEQKYQELALIQKQSLLSILNQSNEMSMQSQSQRKRKQTYANKMGESMPDNHGISLDFDDPLKQLFGLDQEEDPLQLQTVKAVETMPMETKKSNQIDHNQAKFGLSP